MKNDSDNQSEPYFDIGIPYIGGIDYLRETIEAIITQTYSRWRLNVLDNSATRETLELQSQYQKDSRIKFFYLENRYGMAENWNNCLSKAQNDYAIICHSDDIWESSLLTEIVTLINQFPSAAAYFVGGKTIDQNGHDCTSLADWYKSFLLRRQPEHFLIKGEEGLTLLAKGNFIFCSGICFKRRNGQFSKFSENLRFVPDYQLSFDLVLDGREIAGSRAKLCRYRRHGNQATTKLESEKLRFTEEIDLYRYINAVAKNNGWGKAAGITVRCTSLRLHLLLFTLKTLKARRFSVAWHHFTLALSKFT